MIKLEEYTGQGVRVAVLDTGVYTNHQDLITNKILEYSVDDDCNVIYSPGISDDFGHGTACSWLIQRMAKNAEIISIKCLDKKGTGVEVKIIEALKWCLESNIDIINMSLGALSVKYVDEFKKIGREAHDKNIFIMASCHDSGYESVPACIDYFIPVLGKSIKGKNVFYYSDGKFITNGGRQRVAWISPNFILSEGSSFATARMSGIAALFRESFPQYKYDFFLNELKNNASDYRVTEIKPIIRDRIVEYNSNYFDIKKAIIFSFTKEMQTLINFVDLCKFSIEGVVDLPFKGKIGRKVSEFSSGSDDMVICGSLQKCLEVNDCDTVIISRTSTYESVTQRDILGKALEIAITNLRNVYSLEYLDVNMYPKIYELANKNGLKIRHPILSINDFTKVSGYRDLYGHLGSKIPVIGVFGTGPSQGKLTVQLILRKLLTQYGYKVNNYGTETDSELYGFEGFYPLEMSRSIRFSDNKMIEYIQGDMRRIEIENKPEIIIVGAQSGTIPATYATNSTEYTLPTIQFLMATVPHAYILTINSFDNINFIKRTISVIENLGKGKIIAISMNRMFKEMVDNSSIVKSRLLSHEEYESKRKLISDVFDVPVYDPWNDHDAELMAKEIIVFFS